MLVTFWDKSKNIHLTVIYSENVLFYHNLFFHDFLINFFYLNQFKQIACKIIIKHNDSIVRAIARAYHSSEWKRVKWKNRNKKNSLTRVKLIFKRFGLKIYNKNCIQYWIHTDCLYMISRAIKWIDIVNFRRTVSNTNTQLHFQFNTTSKS